MAKPVLMIHDFKKEYLDLPLKDYTLTFDDGLISPLDHWDDIAVIPTEKIFFIPTFAIGNGIEDRHFSEFLALDDIMYLDRHDDVTIGGHSHNHRRMNTFNRFVEALDYLTNDTEMMCRWFEENLGYRPKHFCFPYNETNGVYDSIVRLQFGIPNLYGAERIDIEELL